VLIGVTPSNVISSLVICVVISNLCRLGLSPPDASNIISLIILPKMLVFLNIIISYLFRLGSGIRMNFCMILDSARFWLNFLTLSSESLFCYLKGIVSRDFVVGFLVSFDRSEVSTQKEQVHLLLKFRFRVKFFDFRVWA
jgi:hypothetical protein